MKNICITILLISISLPIPRPGRADDTLLCTESDSISYAFGVLMGNDVKNDTTLTNHEIRKEFLLGLRNGLPDSFEKKSYYVIGAIKGMTVQNLLNNDVSLKYKDVVEGITDCISGKQAKMSEEECRKAICKYANAKKTGKRLGGKQTKKVAYALGMMWAGRVDIEDEIKGCGTHKDENKGQRSIGWLTQWPENKKPATKKDSTEYVQGFKYVLGCYINTSSIRQEQHSPYYELGMHLGEGFLLTLFYFHNTGFSPEFVLKGVEDMLMSRETLIDIKTATKLLDIGSTESDMDIIEYPEADSVMVVEVDTLDAGSAYKRKLTNINETVKVEMFDVYPSQTAMPWLASCNEELKKRGVNLYENQNMLTAKFNDDNRILADSLLNKATLPKDACYGWVRSPGMHDEWELIIYDGFPVLRSEITNIDIQSEREGFFSIYFTFDKAATAQFAELTHKRIGKSIAVMLNGKLYNAPCVQSEITSGQMVVRDLTEEELHEIIKLDD